MTNQGNETSGCNWLTKSGVVAPFNSPQSMRTLLFPFVLSLIAFADTPKLPGIGEAMGEMIAKGEVAGVVTVVAKKDGLLHLEDI